MLLGKYYISDHAFEQYKIRMEYENNKLCTKAIKYDLRTLNIKRIIRRIDGNIYVFTRGCKEFVFRPCTINPEMLVLTTFIKRNVDDTNKTIYKREKTKHLAHA